MNVLSPLTNDKAHATLFGFGHLSCA